MTPLRTFFLICILGFIIWCFYKLFKLWKMPEPTPGKECDPNQVWADSSCSTVKEVQYDPTLVSPKGKSMVLLSFETQGTSIQPVYNPVWYRFRYVNLNTGGYSDFSDWTASAVMSGSCCLPCPGGVGNCDSTIGNGYTTCKANLPTLGIETTESDYKPFIPFDAQGDSVVASVHRYMNPPDVMTKPADDVKDDIVGVMNTTKNVSGKSYYAFIDWKYPACGSTDTSSGPNNYGKCPKGNSACSKGNITCNSSQC